MTISAVAGVLLSPQEAAYLVGALDELLRETGLQPDLKLENAIGQLRRATHKCGVPCSAATTAESSRADEADDQDDHGYVTVSTNEAARILGVGTSAVRALAQRNPGKLGSVRIRGRWRHDKTRVHRRAVRREFGQLVHDSHEPGVT